MAASGAWAWARRAPAERLTLPACGAAWTAAEAMHLAHVHGTDVALGAMVAAGFAGMRVSHKAQARDEGRRHGRHVAAGITTIGSWLAVATAAGPLAGPWHAVSLTWAAGSLGGYLWLRRHPAVAGARQWRGMKESWLTELAPKWGLRSTFLLDYEETRLGERYLVDVRGTGKRASSYRNSDLAERVAETEQLPVTRVKVDPHRIAGRVEISIRRRDPWAHPVPHPVLAADPELDLPVPCTIREPACIGIDPETGRPLTLLLCGKGGGRNVNVVATIEAGKTTLASCISERVTAAGDALLFRINLSIKGDGERDLWGPACHLSAFGPRETGRARRVLAVLAAIIEWRSAQPKTQANWVPTPEDPHLVLITDEIDALAADPVCKRDLATLNSKGREFGYSSVRLGQRGTADWTGGGNVRAVDGVICLGRVTSAGEAMHLGDDIGFRLPDMSEYGEGRPGVWAVADRAAGGHLTGRSFDLSEPRDVRRIVAERARYQPDLKPALRQFLGEEYERLLSTDVFARWVREQDGVRVIAHSRPDLPASPPPPGDAGARDARVGVLAGEHMDALDAEAEAAVDPGLRKLWLATGQKIDAARNDLAEAVPVEDDSSVTPEIRREHAAEEWRKLGLDTEIPDQARSRLLGLLAGGTTISEVAGTLGVTKWTARIYLERLRAEGRVKITGERRTARWILLPETGSGDGS